MADFENESSDGSEDDSSDEEDYGRSVQMLGSKLSSWSYIVQSIKNCQNTRRFVDSDTIQSAAQQAFLCEDFSNAIQLFAVALDQTEQKIDQSSMSTNQNRTGCKIPLLSTLKTQLLEMQDIVGTAISRCTTFLPPKEEQEHDLEEDLDLDPDVKRAIESILSFYAKYNLGNATLLSQASAFFLSCKDYDLALNLSDKAVALDPLSILAQEVHENISCHLVERWHFIMLNDESRNRTYENAIIRGINRYSGEVSVCDVGCGTGLLSLIASNQLKCRSVHAIEKMKIMADIARKVFVENLREESISKINLVNKLSSKMSVPRDLPNHAQILVTETFDAGLFGEGILPTLCHAWSNLLHQGEGKMHSMVIPNSAKLYVQAIESAAILNESRLTSDADLYSLSHNKVCICSTVGMCSPDPYTTYDLKRLPGGFKTLSEPFLFMEVDFNNPQELSELDQGSERQFSMTVTSRGCLHALAMWFSLCLLDNEEISTHTDCHGCWEQAIFPVNPQKLRQRGSDLNVAKGDILRVSQLVRGAQHSLSVTGIDRASQDDKKLSIDGELEDGTESQPFLASTLEWCKSQIYCLSSSEVAMLNNARLSQALSSQLHKLLPRETDGFKADFVHLNCGFSPLCLKAIILGYTHAWAIANNPVQQVLTWKLAQESSVDISRVTLVEDAEEIHLDISSARGLACEGDSGPRSNNSFLHEEQENDHLDDSRYTRGNSGCSNEAKRNPSQCQESQSEICVVALDVVDWQGRLLEDLTERVSVLRTSIPSYRKVCILPHRVDVYGLLIESEELLARSRVVSDDRTLGYKIASFVNRFSTRNHQGILLESLPHTKLCKPFRMFSIDLEKLLLDSNQPATEKSSETMTDAAQNPSYTSHKQSSQDIQCEPSSHKPSSGLPFSNKNIVNECLKYEGEMSITMEQKLPLNKTAGVSTPHLHRDNERKNDPEDNPGEDQCEAIVITGNGLDQTADITVRITASGTVTALVYWFHLYMSDNKVSSTVNSVTETQTCTTDASAPASDFSSPTSSLTISQPNPTKTSPTAPPVSERQAASTLSTSTSPRSYFVPDVTFARSHTDPGSPRQASSSISTMAAPSNLSQTPNTAKVDHVPISSSSCHCPSNVSDPILSSSNTSISTLDPAHHWQQAAVMADPGQGKKTVFKGNDIHLKCVMGSSAFSFYMED